MIDAGAAVVDDRGRVSWPYSLDPGEERQLDLWVRLPDEIGPAPFRATIQTGTAGDYVDHAQVQLTVDVQPPE